MTSRKAGFDLPAIVPLCGTQARQAGKSNPYRPAPTVRYVQDELVITGHLKVPTDIEIYRNATMLINVEKERFTLSGQ